MKDIVPDFQLSINEPCHENWDRMLPAEKGKFCLSCHKVVHDFTQKTKEEIIEFFRLRKFQTVCARVNDDVLVNPNEAVKNLIRKKATFRLAWFAYALFLVFGSALFSCNTTDPKVMQQERQLVGMMKVPDNFDRVVFQENKVQKENCLNKKLTADKRSDEQSFKHFSDTLLLPEIIVEESNIADHFSGRVGEVSAGYFISEVEFTNIPVFPHSPLGKAVEKSITVPDEPSLEIFPNPSSGQFQVRYKLVRPAPVELDVFNISGQFVDRIMASQQMEEGEYLESFNLEDLAAGIYFLRMQTGELALTGRLVITR